jgi:site-specific DNA-methyltransferase (adenine-specific)
LKVIHGDCIDVLREMPDASIDAIVTDPPYELGFMGKHWDASGVAYNVDLWRDVLRVLKPGGHLLTFGGTRTWHRLACAIEDAGFEVRDSIAWLYGSGFPKSLDVSKAIDKAAGVEREVVGKARLHSNVHSFANSDAYTATDFRPDITAPATDDARRWQGWGTALKPAHEPIVVARRPLDGTVAANVLRHGTGALNIDGCRIGTDDRFGGGAKATSGFVDGYEGDGWTPGSTLGRWPANVVLDESQAAELGEHSRFFYVAKAPTRERPNHDGIKHPTVKPLALMRYLIKLVTPPGGVVLDPFAGSGTTAEACVLEGFQCIAIEREADYIPLITQRLARVADNGSPT